MTIIKTKSNKKEKIFKNLIQTLDLKEFFSLYAIHVPSGKKFLNFNRTLNRIEVYDSINHDLLKIVEIEEEDDNFSLFNKITRNI